MSCNTCVTDLRTPLQLLISVFSLFCTSESIDRALLTSNWRAAACTRECGERVLWQIREAAICHCVEVNKNSKSVLSLQSEMNGGLGNTHVIKGGENKTVPESFQ